MAEINSQLIMNSAFPAGGATGTLAFYSMRQVCAITGGSASQVRVTFQAPVDGPGSVAHASVGVWTGSFADVNATPAVLLFGGNPGFSALAANTTITSDWTNLSGFTPNDFLVVIMDNATASVADSMAAQASPIPLYSGFFAWQYNNPTYNIAAPGLTGLNTNYGLQIGVTRVEVQGVGLSLPPIAGRQRPISVTNLGTNRVVAFDTVADVLLGNPFFTFANYEPGTYEMRNDSGTNLTVALGGKNYTVAAGQLWTFNVSRELGPLVGWRYVSGTRVYG